MTSLRKQTTATIGTIGLVGPMPPPNGGMAMQTVQLARLLQESGTQVVVEQTNRPYQPAWVGRVRGLRALFRLVPYLASVWRLAGEVSVIHLMANSGWSWQLFAAPVVWIGRVRNTPVIVNYRGGEAREYLRRSHRWVIPTLQRAACIAVPSGFLAEVFAEYGCEAQIVPNIVDLDTFRPSQSGAADHVFRVVITRNLEPIYGIDTALRALSIISRQTPELVLEIAGSGAERDHLEQLAAELGVRDRVNFLGRLGRAEVAELYRRSQLALNPTRVDNMPNSVLEALASGLPVVSTDVGGVPFIVEDNVTALLVPPDDPEAMAAAIMRLYGNPALCARLGGAGRESVRGYSWENVGADWLELYSRLGHAA